MPNESLLVHWPPETWGDKFHRAYRLARRRYGKGFTYREAARRVSVVLQTNDAAILRLESFDTMPTTPRQRALAVYCLVVYGFEPGVLGFTEHNVDAEVLANLLRLNPD